MHASLCAFYMGRRLKKNQTINNLSPTLILVCAYNFDSLFRHNITSFLSHPTLQPLPFKRGKISSREAEFCTEEYFLACFCLELRK